MSYKDLVFLAALFSPLAAYFLLLIATRQELRDDDTDLIFIVGNASLYYEGDLRTFLGEWAEHVRGSGTRHLIDGDTYQAFSPEAFEARLTSAEREATQHFLEDDDSWKVCVVRNNELAERIKARCHAEAALGKSAKNQDNTHTGHGDGGSFFVGM
jgi:hypothetical protein